MNRRLALTSAVFAIALPLALSGCGNKGPLVMPAPPTETSEPAADPLQPAPAPEPVPASETAAPAPPASSTPAR